MTISEVVSRGARSIRRGAPLLLLIATSSRLAKAQFRGSETIETRRIDNYGGTITLDSFSSGGADIDIRILGTGFGGFFLDGPTFFGLQSVSGFFSSIEAEVTVTTHGGASLDDGTTFHQHTEDRTYGGAGFFDVNFDPTTHLGEVIPDAQDYSEVSHDCAPVAPSGLNSAGVPYYGGFFIQFPFYFDTCTPGSYVDITFGLGGGFGDVSFSTPPDGSVPFTTASLLAEPEPSDLTLCATGLFAIAAASGARRLRRPSRPSDGHGQRRAR